MKATELMIGDLVCYSKANNWITKVEAVGNPGQTYISDVYDIKCYRHKDDPLYEKAPIDFFNVDILHPIPLTEDFFKANGYKYDGDAAMQGKHVTIFYGDKKHGWEVNVYRDDLEPYGKSVTVHIKYVHEFQHVLRMCGIKKKIVVNPET